MTLLQLKINREKKKIKVHEIIWFAIRFRFNGKISFGKYVMKLDLRLRMSKPVILLLFKFD